MSITDSSSSLSSSWSEKSVVSFNQGSLADIDDCVSEVESKLFRGTLGASTRPTLNQVKQWLVRAKQELSEVKGFTFKRRYASVNTSSGNYRYALPPDYNGGRIMLRDTTSDLPITIWPEYWFDQRYPDPSGESAGQPVIATIKNMELWLNRPTDGVYALELDYDRSGADNTPNDFSWLPEIERFRCCDFAISEAFESLHLWQQAQLYREKWNTGIGRAIRADGKRKWKRMRFQALSMFQEYVVTRGGTSGATPSAPSGGSVTWQGGSTTYQGQDVDY